MTAGTNNFAIHVADTLLTNIDGSLHANDAIKSAIVHCTNATCVLSYTGLAYIDNKRIDEWIVAQLRKFDAPSKDLKQIADFLTKAFTDAIARNPALGRYGLTVVINGLGVLARGLHEQAMGWITNMQEPRPKRNDLVYVKPLGRPFRCFVWTPTPGAAPPEWFMSVNGSVSQKLNIGGHRRKIIRDLQAAKTEDELSALLDSLVAMLRNQRRDPKVGKVVGEDCNAIVIGRTYEATTRFYSSKGTVVKRRPHVVGTRRMG